jgi:hypothetical protein
LSRSPKCNALRTKHEQADEKVFSFRLAPKAGYFIPLNPGVTVAVGTREDGQRQHQQAGACGPWPRTHDVIKAGCAPSWS